MNVCSPIHVLCRHTWPPPTPLNAWTHVCVCMRGMLVVSKLSGWMGGTTSPLTGLKTGKVERGHEISRFLDMFLSSLLDFWMELWWTSWMLGRGRRGDVKMHKLVLFVMVRSVNLPYPVCNALLIETDLTDMNMQSTWRALPQSMHADAHKYNIHPFLELFWLLV